MSLVGFLREKWRLMRAERARGEASRQRVFELLRTIRENERKRIEDIKRIEAQQAAEEHRQKVQEEAYLLWEADGKPEGKDDYYWKLATDKVKGKNVPALYKPYYFLEKRILEPSFKMLTYTGLIFKMLTYWGLIFKMLTYWGLIFKMLT